MRGGWPAGAARAVLLLAALAGCGAPGSGTRVLEPAEVPYGLLSPAPTTTAPQVRVPEAATGPRAYFPDTDRVLVPVPLRVPVDDGASATLRAALARLAAGPDVQRRGEGLSSALGPDVRLRLEALEDGTARVEVSQLRQDPAADRIPLAVGQIVLTATSVPGVEAVQLLLDGEVLDVPLPGGARTSALLRAQDYAVLTAPPTAPPAAATAGPSTGPTMRGGG